MAQGLCFLLTLSLGNPNKSSPKTLAISATVYLGYYKLAGVIAVFIFANLLYVFVNLDTIAAEQLKESIVVENYRFLIEGLIGSSK
jgi:hypothetical protein